MTRLLPTGGDPDEFTAHDTDPRRLAADVPRVGVQRHPEPAGEVVDDHHDPREP